MFCVKEVTPEHCILPEYTKNRQKSLKMAVNCYMYVRTGEYHILSWLSAKLGTGIEF